MTRGRYRLRARFIVDGETVDREQIVEGERLDDMLRAELLTPGLVVRIRVDLLADAPSTPVDTSSW